MVAVTRQPGQETDGYVYQFGLGLRPRVPTRVANPLAQLHVAANPAPIFQPIS